MKTFRLLVLSIICSLPILPAKADKSFIDLSKYTQENITVAENADGSVTLSLSDSGQGGYVLFGSLSNFTGWEKLYFTFASSATPNGAFTYIITDNSGNALYDNSEGGGKYQPFNSASGTGTLDFVKLSETVSNLSDCYFAVKVSSGTELTCTLSNVYVHTAVKLPTGATDIQSVPYMKAGAPTSISMSISSLLNWTGGRSTIIGDGNNWNVSPGKYWDLSEYKSLNIQITSSPEMAGEGFQIRAAGIDASMAIIEKLVDVTLTGSTQQIEIDLTKADVADWLSVIQFQNTVNKASVSLDIDYIVVSNKTTTDIETPVEDKKKAGAVYNLQGVKVLNNATQQEAITTLPDGLYILDGKKIFINK